MLQNSTTINIKDENDTDLDVTYTLFKTENLYYSYKILLHDKNTNEDTYQIYENFTDNEDIARHTYNLLIKNEVLPAHLINILDEIN